MLLASFAYENSRLLLVSKSSAYPKGLSNNHGQVGRHYFSHHQGAPVTALFPFNVGAWYGLPAQGVAVDNWADDNFDHADLEQVAKIPGFEDAGLETAQAVLEECAKLNEGVIAAISLSRPTSMMLVISGVCT